VILQHHGETTQMERYDKTQNKKKGPTNSINNSYEFRGSSSPRAASVLFFILGLTKSWPNEFV
jgi:hypothetical protein